MCKQGGGSTRKTKIRFISGVSQDMAVNDYGDPVVGSATNCAFNFTLNATITVPYIKRFTSLSSSCRLDKYLLFSVNGVK